jgi:hypothetical protein
VAVLLRQMRGVERIMAMLLYGAASVCSNVAAYA